MAATDTTFLAEICRREHWIRIIFGISALFFVLHIPYLVVVDPGTALYVVAVMNIVGTGAFMVASGVVIRKCQSVETY